MLQCYSIKKTEITAQRSACEVLSASSDHRQSKAADTKEVARRIAHENTVSSADMHVVIRTLPEIMSQIMSERHQSHRMAGTADE